PARPQDGPTPARFGFETVAAKARALAAAPFDGAIPASPAAIAAIGFDEWNAIRFRPERAFLAHSGGPFRLHLFHLGHLYRRPVTVNLLRDGVPAPIPYSPDLFDFGAMPAPSGMPVDLGFAGFRLNYPLNDPRRFDEAIAFLGSSYFRFLSRGQSYGLSARALGLKAGEPGEEFPFFREFWIETPAQGAAAATIHALLDSSSVCGAYRFGLFPGDATAVEVEARLFARTETAGLDFAPMSSMYFTGPSGRRLADPARPEVHDSDGLLVEAKDGARTWRPLRNPAARAAAAFGAGTPQGFGLMQRERGFAAYRDLDRAYQSRPGYWVEPAGDWGAGRVKLVELPTPDENEDNIVASYSPDAPLPAGVARELAYRMTAVGGGAPGTSALAGVLATSRPSPPVGAPAGTARFWIDFAGGDLALWLRDPSGVTVEATASSGPAPKARLEANRFVDGFRVTLDAPPAAPDPAELRVTLRGGGRALSETWTFGRPDAD
ncbi:MAG: glucan biosynthesis protein, partial [Hyphomicrobiales bacterium]|nr:glucan biosynthesis protein [Hyphomicrobiales bacterium]